VLPPSNAYAFSYEIQHFPFKLVDTDELGSSIRNIFESYEHSNFDVNNSINDRKKDILRSNEEMIHEIQKNGHAPNYLRAAIETSVLLWFVSLYYWGTKSSADDFDYDINFDTLKKKFSGQAILFDDNSIGTNSFPGHPISGAYFYLIARNHNLSPTESFLWSFAASTINEFFIEFTEVASISGLVVTPVAEAVIGEAMYEFGKYFRCTENRDDLTYKVLAAFMDPIALVNSFVWCDIPYRYSKDNICHFSPIQKDISIFSGVSVSYHENTNNSTIGPIFGFYGKLYLIP
jgi:uncharacterized protein DUF3943